MIVCRTVLLALGSLLLLGSFLGRRHNRAGSLWDAPPELYTEGQKGRVALVTGANAGLGLETARGLYRAGFDVMIGARSRAKADGAASLLRAEEGAGGGGKVVGVALDLARLSSVRAAAAEVGRLYPKGIDVLINNAGIWASQTLTEDGIGETAQVNHYGHFLLTQLLLPLLVRSADPRVVLLSSALAAQGVDMRKDWTLVDPAKKASAMGGVTLYGTSKLMNVLHAKALAIHAPWLVVNAVHPGVIKTELHDEHDDGGWFVARVIRPILYTAIGITQWEGALPALHAATDPTSRGWSGRYVAGALPRTGIHPLEDDDGLAYKLWKISVALTGSPEIHSEAEAKVRKPKGHGAKQEL